MVGGGECEFCVREVLKGHSAGGVLVYLRDLSDGLGFGVGGASRVLFGLGLRRRSGLWLEQYASETGRWRLQVLPLARTLVHWGSVAL